MHVSFNYIIFAAMITIKLYKTMMKAKVLLFLLGTFNMTVRGQALSEVYHPFVEDNKTWETYIGDTPECVYYNCIDGDTIINGESWKKVYNSFAWPEFNNSYYVAVRDVGKKVYAIAKGSNKPRLLYNYDLKVGSLLRCGVEGNAFGCLLDTDEQPDTLLGFEFKAYLRVESIDTVNMFGVDRRRLKLTMLDPYKSDFMAEEDGGIRGNIVWIEGIGSGAGPFLPWLPLPQLWPDGISYLSCAIGKNCIFNSKGFYNDPISSSIGSTQQITTVSNPLFDMLGRHLNSQLQKGLYIQNGRKVVVK